MVRRKTDGTTVLGLTLIGVFSSTSWQSDCKILSKLERGTERRRDKYWFVFVILVQWPGLCACVGWADLLLLGF